MSTNATIMFLKNYPRDTESIDFSDDENPMVYIHHDGYPEGVLPLLVDYLKTDGAKSRNHDAEYLSAYYLAYLIIQTKGYELDEFDDYTEYGITSSTTITDYNYGVVNNFGEFTIFVCDAFGEVIDITSPKTYKKL